jgi:O-methyltransferase involved in polyketide biosynthesis
MNDAAAIQTALSAVPSTLLIPLAARAHGDALFPQVSVGDATAAPLLGRLTNDVRPFLADRTTVYGVLVRTRIFRDLTVAFLDGHPGAVAANLGCGLADYGQWCGSRAARWIDADLPEVIALRDTLLPADDGRRCNVAVDLSAPGWWRALGLPEGHAAAPVALICEGVSMYLEPAQVQAFLAEFGTHAPDGSQLLLDAMNWLAVGRAHRHRSVKHTGAQFRWGPRRIGELAAAHPRLVLQAEHPVMEGYGWPYAQLGPLFRWLFGVPFYGIAQITVREAH